MSLITFSKFHNPSIILSTHLSPTNTPVTHQHGCHRTSTPITAPTRLSPHQHTYHPSIHLSLHQHACHRTNTPITAPTHKSPHQYTYPQINNNVTHNTPVSSITPITSSTHLSINKQQRHS